MPEKINKKVALVGGGIGVPPLLFLANKLSLNYPEIALTAILGFRDEPILINDFENCGVVTHIATDDGSIGFKGNAVELLESLNETFDIIYGCGPKIMLKGLAKWAKTNNTLCYISLEERMACGFGACVGCVCPIADKDGTVFYKKVCTDGPVFNALEVVFD